MEHDPTMTVAKLPLDSVHRSLGARMGQFGDWEVPLYYTSILDEHAAVRQKAGVFDISHMGEFEVQGAGATAFLDAILPRPISPMTFGQALYSPLLNDQGGLVDDIIVYRRQAEHYLLIVNAGNIAKDFAHIFGLKELLAPSLGLHDISAQWALLAVQGPLSAAILEKALGDSFEDLPYYHFRERQDGIVSRTGYTGEDGFEIMVKTAEVKALWNRLFEAGRSQGLQPVGFGARDTLRLEAGMPLYGHDLNDETTPFESHIGWAVKLAKGEFVGRRALISLEESGRRKKLVGFEMTERGIPRQGQEIRKTGEPVGVVTSGSFSPTLKKNIGMAFVSDLGIQEGDAVDVMVRDNAVSARVVKLPFYRRNKK